MIKTVRVVCLGAAIPGFLFVGGNARGQTASSSSGTAEQINVTGNGPGTAAGVAPSRPDITEQQPTSVITSDSIRKFAVPTSDYNDLIQLTPSAMDISPAGPGLQQDFGQSIRGLQYTEFSVLFDGLQVQPSPGNLSPQPAVYFFARDLGSVTVNRGPGMVSDIGSATFGGFIAMTSQPTSTTPYAEAYTTFGSFGTKLFGAEAQSGTITQLGGARIAVDLTREEALGADTGLQTERRNLYLKYDQPIGESTLLTGFVNLDNDETNTPYGTSLKNILRFGPNYSLNGNPLSQSFAGANRDEYTTDFDYLRVRSDLGAGFKVEGTIYTQGYYHRGTQSLDPGGSSADLINRTVYINGVATHVADDLQGTADHNDQRDWGALLKVSKDTTIGQGRVGVWFDHIDNDTYRYMVDFTRGTVPYATTASGTPYQYNLFDTLTTVQPYGEFEFKPTRNLSVTAGVKYDAVTRSLEAPLDRTSPPDARGRSRGLQSRPAGILGQRTHPPLALGLRAGGERLPDATAECLLLEQHHCGDAVLDLELPGRQRLSAELARPGCGPLLHRLQQLHLAPHHRRVGRPVFQCGQRLLPGRRGRRNGEARRRLRVLCERFAQRQRL